MLLLVAQSAERSGTLTRIQKPNDVDVLAPIVLGVQAALLDEAVAITPTKALIKRALALSWMRLNQNAIVSESSMMRRNQWHRGFASIRIVTNLVVLWMRRGNHLVALEVMMNDGLPSSHLALAK